MKAARMGPRPAHRARGEGRFLEVVHAVALRAGGPALQREAEVRPDVEAHREEERAPHEPDARAVQKLAQEGAVVVERLRAVREERLKVADHVAENEK